ncbi:metallophosphoesterase [Salimicrobium flavidum]|uniref:Calcineurin-like phosphoesterase domain-containing protein n=1 Tax=Salimicrobium flavidum TaxID=570947 RepID=A0A1N7J8E1_9BACI|nr:metallophosphoesterase [Salimicrobium flavidum]SIS45564.1 hypothetical protein SAMN05421687_104129 [Salimicrobium flavidum]
MKIHKNKWLYVLLSLPFLLYFFYFQNNSLVVSDYTVSSDDLPQAFDGYRIVQLSDLHNKSFGKNQRDLVQKVESSAPDSIVFTGDLIDSTKYKEPPSLILMEELVQIAPVYYVTGNHEWESGRFNTFEEKLTDIGVQVMRNKTERIARDGEEILMTGIDDPANAEESISKNARTKKNITDAMGEMNEDDFQILLAHRPEMISLYAEYGFDVVFSGHAHGGQFRLPYTGGLFAPGQGFFPEYTSGKHMLDGTAMIVNRGLGNSIIPVRIFNRPEIVTVTLKSER